MSVSPWVPIFISLATAAFSAFTWFHTDREAKSLRNDVFRHERWSEIRRDIEARRINLENAIADYQDNSLHALGNVDAHNQLRAAYRSLLRAHALLQQSTDRAARSPYVNEQEKWRGVTYAPVVQNETLLDRTGELQNAVLQQIDNRQGLELIVEQTVNAFQGMIRELDDMLTIEDCHHDPDKI
ncbi:MAG: hypothetical protein ACTS1Z_14640 [Parasphingopyxis sp.]|uniref:hypothetical protein n=1 Tax=Parasphingopyxis sp. TaxID=1920299 RepID=UPI003F9F0143